MMENEENVKLESLPLGDLDISEGEIPHPCTPQNSHFASALNSAVNNSDANASSSFLLIGKLKSVVYEVLYNLENYDNMHDVDEFIAVTEDCLRALKTVKVERRIESRRINLSMRNQTSSSVNTTTPSNRDPDDALAEAVRPSVGTISQGPHNYKAALLRQKRPSPKRSPLRAEAQTRSDVEAARYTSALRAEERQRQAEERRFDHLQELKQKQEVADARNFRAKTRREEAETKQRLETQDRMDNGVRRAEEARRQTREKAQRTLSHVEEVLLTKELQQQNKALVLDKKMSEVEQNQEQMREKLQKQAQDRQEAVRAAAERRRNLSQERQERQQLREQQRMENLRRVDEQKKMEQEAKQQKAKQWEKKVQQHHVDATAEAEAQIRKTEEKFLQSAQLLEEQREKRQQKLERQEQKLREAKERRDMEPEVQPTLEEMMPRLSDQEEEQLATRISRLSTTSAHHGKVFADNYQKTSTHFTKDLNRSRLRPIISRLAAAAGVSSVAQCKHPLNELSAVTLGDADFEFVRYFNAFETLVKVLVEAQKARDFGVVGQTTDVLQSWCADDAEGRESVVYFIKSGCVVPLLMCVRDEAKALRLQHNAEILQHLLGVVCTCFERVNSDTQGGSKLAPARDQLLNEVHLMDLDRVCVAVLQTCSTEDELAVAYAALCVIYNELIVMTRRKGEVKKHWFQQITTALFTLLQNMLTPHGAPLRECDASLSSERVTILFCIFRTLNTLARWQLTKFQELLHDGSTDAGAAVDTAHEKKGGLKRTASVESLTTLITRTELFHVLTGFFMYIHGHLEELESIPVTEDVAAAASKEGSASFAEALQFGVTLSTLPAYPSTGRGELRDSQRMGKRDYHLRATLHECILLVGYLCFDDAPLQDMLGWGRTKPLLGTMLNVLPIAYFSNARHILFPTILAALLQNNRNSMIVREEMSLAELQQFVAQEYGPLTKKAKVYAQEQHKMLVAHKMETDSRFALMVRLQGKSWADMEDDDDDSPPATTLSSETLSTTPAIEKEKLCKGLRGTLLNPSNYFKLERRLPISYWPAVLEQLEKLRQI